MKKKKKRARPMRRANGRYAARATTVHDVDLVWRKDATVIWEVADKRCSSKDDDLVPQIRVTTARVSKMLFKGLIHF